MHSSPENTKPTRIANASFGTTTTNNPSICRALDALLYGNFQGDLYVASVGNDGLDEELVKSKEKTIFNPAACKNSLAGK